MRAFLTIALPLIALASPALAQAPADASGAPPGLPRREGPPAPQGWSLGIGIAPVFGSAWQGSRETSLSVYPDLRLAYGDALFLSVPEGLGWNAVRTAEWKAGPVVKLRFGRDESNGGSPFLIAGGSTALAGMGDIGLAGEAGGFVERRLGKSGQWRARAELRHGFGAHKAIVGEVSLSHAGRIGPVRHTIGPRATFASRSYMQTYFGVNAGQAARTGLALSQPRGGLVSYGIAASAILPLDRNRAILGFGGIDRLGSRPAGSALIRERGQATSFTLGIAYSYRFGL